MELVVRRHASGHFIDSAAKGPTVNFSTVALLNGRVQGVHLRRHPERCANDRRPFGDFSLDDSCDAKIAELDSAVFRDEDVATYTKSVLTHT